MYFSTSKVTALWHFTNMLIVNIIIIIYMDYGTGDH